MGRDKTGLRSTRDSSPHARGKPLLICSARRAMRLIPACAGKTRNVDTNRIQLVAHPRMRGENGAIKTGLRSARGSSPHARGKRTGGVGDEPRRGLIPACAGKTGRACVLALVVRAHPRMRGENLLEPAGVIAADGSSPHARGKLLGWVGHQHLDGLIPACAGKTHRVMLSAKLAWAHPRMRGENSALCLPSAAGWGSSPHARGKQRIMLTLGSGLGLIPACAGKTQTVARRGRNDGAHPRMRGENIATLPLPAPLLGSSPHARGKRCRTPGLQVPTGLIPACAGKTLRSEPFHRFHRAHPRMRGENTAPLHYLDTGFGSSPHARGKLVSPLLF